MERLVLEVNNQQNLNFIIELIKKFDFIKSFSVEKTTNKVSRKNLPVDWADNNADIMALAGIWKNKPRNLNEIREKAWKRI